MRLPLGATRLPLPVNQLYLFKSTTLSYGGEIGFRGLIVDNSIFIGSRGSYHWGFVDGTTAGGGPHG